MHAVLYVNILMLCVCITCVHAVLCTPVHSALYVYLPLGIYVVLDA